MFYLVYLRQELWRRGGRTILTVCGLAVGVALVVAVTALSAGLRRAQAQVLGPLAGVGTDMTVTKRNVFAESGFGAALSQQTLQTDISKLGKPGERFSTDTFFTTQPSFERGEARKIKEIDGVSATSRALLLRAIHQEGTVPKPGSDPVQSGTQSATPKPLTDEDRERMSSCLADGGSASDAGTNSDPFGGAFQGLARCLPESQLPLRTDVRSGQFTVAGIDPEAGIGLISADQVVRGRFLERSGEALLSESYASSRDLDVGSTLGLNGRSFEVVGLTKHPLSGDSNDVNLVLGDLQQISDRKGDANVILVRASSAARVGGVVTAVERAIPSSVVSDESDLAGKVAGSLVDSAGLIKGLSMALAMVGIIAAVLIAMLLTLSSVAKRTRELGTLKAMGWGPRIIVRQIVAEAAAQGVLGAGLGIVLGFGAAGLLGTLGPSLTARTVGTSGTGDWFGIRSLGDQASDVIRLTAPVRPAMVVTAAAVALAAGLAAGAVGAMRAARLRPADAMRDVS